MLLYNQYSSLRTPDAWVEAYELVDVKNGKNVLYCYISGWNCMRQIVYYVNV